MENDQWTTKYQQSGPTDLERTEENLNNGNTEHLSEDTKSIKNTFKNEPEDTVKGLDPNLDSNQPNIMIGDKAKQTIQSILEQIKSLTQTEKFLLFLKLPSEVSHAVDPFRQPLNPLGSRSEIYRTISWIKTHLEEDPDISLPKQEVYNGYYNYCEKNSVKPLSQADFGKVMKQVYPRVRARRLGTRGNSRYCYSGLRRCVKLKPPVLPDLADKPLSTEAPFTQSNLTSAAWLIVKDWSEQQLGTQFSSIQALAYYLILNHSIGSGTEAATKITNAAETLKPDDVNGKSGNKHREMQLQLQRKIQQKNEGKERKRKLMFPKSEQKPSGKKSRSQSVPAPPAVPVMSPTVQLATSNGTTSGECSTASSSSTSPTQGKPICDKSLDFTQLPALPDFNSFQKPSADELLGNGESETPLGTSTNKVAIPRLQATPIPLLTAPPKKATEASKPRLQQCDIAPYNPQSLNLATEDNRSQDLHIIDRIKESKSDDDCDVPDFPLTRERLNSVSNVEKDAMDEYLGTNNSQHEEELSKYFSNNNVSDTVESENTSKLSTLRQLLEQNGIVENKPCIQNNQKVLENTVVPERASYRNNILNQTPIQNRSLYITPITHQANLPCSSTNIKRRVSFETPAPEDSVPPSPNTRRKNFSFTPISPGPQSPNSQSKCSSTNASPFVSPRSTPILRIKNGIHQPSGIIKSETRKPVKIKKEPDLSLDIPNEIQFAGSNFMPMSAPASPMLTGKSVLQKLLNSSSKVAYSPGYANTHVAPALQSDTSHEVSQLFASNIQSNIDCCRSQSVPLHQMMVKSLPIDPSFLSQQNVNPGEFSEIDPIPESETDNVKRILNSLDEQACDNNNIDIFNLDITNPCLSEFGIHMINNNLEIGGFSQNSVPYNSISTDVPLARNMRSQSMDVNITYESKCNPSRSVPNTPLSFMQNIKPEIKSYGHNSRSYPSTPLNSQETFTYNVNGDCLLNGQPIRSDGLPEELVYNMQNYGINGDNNIAQLPHAKNFNLQGNDFSIVENDPALMDESCVLLEQNYSSNIN
ncbi:hypothetical protein NQ315_009435 [Exocentrus adspersus]|uniref:RFX-type winged-helix domain-containing protein n=1 Tax=Exocentrus adspersus TaxID=1586481 RepID=A0AAV8WHK1_9CUCU|nr:hypothetical protein NQ315_009435 [Exocentrus adspersus]